MVDRDGWVQVTDFPSSGEASVAGASLLEAGIVAQLDQVGAGTSALLVQRDDVPRACELLDVPEPVEPLLPLDQPLPVESTRWRLPRERLPLFVIGYIVVLVALCVAVFFVVVWLLGGYDGTEGPTVTVP